MFFVVTCCIFILLKLRMNRVLCTRSCVFLLPLFFVLFPFVSGSSHRIPKANQKINYTWLQQFPNHKYFFFVFIFVITTHRLDDSMRYTSLYSEKWSVFPLVTYPSLFSGMFNFPLCSFQWQCLTILCIPSTKGSLESETYNFRSTSE